MFKVQGLRAYQYSSNTLSGACFPAMSMSEPDIASRLIGSFKVFGSDDNETCRRLLHRMDTSISQMLHATGQGEQGWLLEVYLNALAERRRLGGRGRRMS